MASFLAFLRVRRPHLVPPRKGLGLADAAFTEEIRSALANHAERTPVAENPRLANIVRSKR